MRWTARLETHVPRSKRVEALLGWEARVRFAIFYRARVARARGTALRRAAVFWFAAIRGGYGECDRGCDGDGIRSGRQAKWLATRPPDGERRRPTDSQDPRVF